MDSLHGQLGQLLTDAQGLLADIAPGASGGQFGMHFEYIILTSDYNLTNFKNKNDGISSCDKMFNVTD